MKATPTLYSPLSVVLVLFILKVPVPVLEPFLLLFIVPVVVPEPLF